MKNLLLLSAISLIILLLGIQIHDNKNTINTDTIIHIDETVIINVEEFSNEGTLNDSEIGIEETQSEKIYNTGYITTKVNFRESDSTQSNILCQINFNQEVEYFHLGSGWSKVKYNNMTGYVKSEYISSEQVKFITKLVPKNGFKSYMPYTAITSKSSPQYKLQQIAYTGNYGIRQVNGRFCIAVGSAYETKIGTYIDLILTNGTVIPCVLADQKADVHTDKNNQLTKHDGSLVEFVVDSKNLSKNVKKHGDVSFACKSWNSQIEKIRIYEN